MVGLSSMKSLLPFSSSTGEGVDLPSLACFPDITFDISKEDMEYEKQLAAFHISSYRNIRHMSRYFIDKIVVSGTPVSGSFVVVAMIGLLDLLAYCKSGDKSWKYIEKTSTFTEDVTYMNGLFYDINESAELVVCDLRGDSPVVEFIRTPELTDTPYSQYLVNSMGMLLRVTRLYDQTIPFGLYKLDFGRQRWVEMTSLTDLLLFLGHASSLALKASDFPGYRGNKIYFLDIYTDSRQCDTLEEVGIFDLEDRSFHQMPCVISSASSSVWPPPVWITPNPAIIIWCLLYPCLVLNPHTLILQRCDNAGHYLTWNYQGHTTGNEPSNPQLLWDT